MGEYQEDDFDDLLDSDGEDDDRARGSDDGGTDILDLEDLSIRPEKKNGDDEGANALALADEYLPPDIDGDLDEGDEGDEVSDEESEKRRMEEKKKEAGESRRKLQKLLHSNAPGIDLFLPDEKGENGFRSAVEHLDCERNTMFRYFCMESLDIEKDFGYSRRSKLHEHGFTDSRVTDMLTDR